MLTNKPKTGLTRELWRASSHEQRKRYVAEGKMTQEIWGELNKPERDFYALPATPEALAPYHGMRIEVTYPDGEKSRFWVGKSMGWAPVYTELKIRTSTMGSPVYFPEGSTVKVVHTSRKDRHQERW